jgi:dTDP-glucose 4,6-dehydratase
MSGGAGFIGSHLCEKLLESGHDVLVLDNLLTSTRANLAHLEGVPGFEFENHDVSETISVSGPVDLVLHMASPASPADFPAYPIQIVKVGTLGTHNMLGVALAKKARFLLASTSEIYGDPTVNPQPETYWGNVNPIGPRGAYDESKRCGEAFAMAYHRAHGVDTRIVRIFNTYGPRMRIDDGRVIPNFLSQAIRGQPLTVYGDGSQTRSLCYVDDLVSGILSVIEKGDNLPYNIGNPKSLTMRELAQFVIKFTNSSSSIEYRPLPEDDPKQRQPDITRVQERTGWAPRVELEEGLARTVDYFRAELAER